MLKKIAMLVYCKLYVHHIYKHMCVAYIYIHTQYIYIFSDISDLCMLPGSLRLFLGLSCEPSAPSDEWTQRTINRFFIRKLQVNIAD